MLTVLMLLGCLNDEPRAPEAWPPAEVACRALTSGERFAFVAYVCEPEDGVACIVRSDARPVCWYSKGVVSIDGRSGP